MTAFAHEQFEPPRPGLVPVPDLAGTPAADATGQFFGEVYGALTEADSGLIRYLDLDVHGAGRHVLVPVGHVRVPRAEESAAGVRLRAATAGELAAIPPYHPELPLSDDLEHELLAAHGRLFAGEKYYAHPAFDHSGLYAGERPVASGVVPGEGAPLRRMSELPDYHLTEGEPDIRGWPLLATDGARAGEVADLVVDPEALQVRYLAVRRDDDREILLPVGFLQLDEARHAVLAPGLRAQDVYELPPHSGEVTRAQEEALRAALDRLLDGPRRFLRPDFRRPTRLA